MATPMQVGSRLDKRQWQEMTPEARQAAGMPATFEEARPYFKAWKDRFREGGDVYQKHQQQDETIARALQGNPNAGIQDLMSAMRSAGLAPVKEEGLSRWNQLLSAFKGDTMGGGAFHWDGGGWRDLATSDMNVYGQRNNLGINASNTPHLTGMAALSREIPLLAAANRTASEVGSGQSFLEGRTQDGGYFNNRPNGTTDYFDMFGRPSSGTSVPNPGGAGPYVPPQVSTGNPQTFQMPQTGGIMGGQNAQVAQQPSTMRGMMAQLFGGGFNGSNVGGFRWGA